MPEEKKDFQPYVAPEDNPAEITVTSLITGALLAIIFGAANAYLGLRVGMTISASIPAAVISLTVIRVLLKRNSALESNIVQTIGSAGESLAAGVIYTIPVMFLWSEEGKADSPAMITVTLIALFGGILGVLFMIPLRNSLIVKEHKTLPYPEGTACAEVLLAGEKEGVGARNVFLGMGIAAIIKLLVDGFKVIPSMINVPVKALKTALMVEVYPALIGVGYICGPEISSYMFAGGLLGWLVLIPLIVFFGGNTTLFPGTEPISAMYAGSGPIAIWSCYLRYIGAGMVAAGGFISLLKSGPLILDTFKEAIQGIKDAKSRGTIRTEQNLDMRIVLCGILIIGLLIWLLPQVPISLPGALMTLVFGFFFGAVSSRMVGLVGSSNTPVSGMTIATLLMVTSIMKLTGKVGMKGMIASISISSIVCIITTIASDTSQDLKTGYLLGATPKKQQIGDIFGVLVSAATIGGVLLILNQAWGFGTEEMSAPQATLMKLIIEGIMDGNLPWQLVLIGVFLAIAIELLHIPVLPVAIGLYLPVSASCGVAIGGGIRFLVEKGIFGRKSSKSGSGILFCSGMIAGEGLIGILLAALAVTGVLDKLDMSGRLNTGLAGSLIMMGILFAAVYISDTNRKD